MAQLERSLGVTGRSCRWRLGSADAAAAGLLARPVLVAGRLFGFEAKAIRHGEGGNGAPHSGVQRRLAASWQSHCDKRG